MRCTAFSNSTQFSIIFFVPFLSANAGLSAVLDDPEIHVENNKIAFLLLILFCHVINCS